jgi:hypothetical protein
VYLTRQVAPTRGEKRNLVSEEGTADFTYSAKKKSISIRNMEIEDLYSVYILGEQIFTAKSINLFNFLELFLLKKMRMLMIDTQENNEAALKLFRKLGFGHDKKHLYLSGKVNAQSI